jgi:hypothetical protein
MTSSPRLVWPPCGLDDPDLTIYATTLGRRYIVHVLPVVPGELDELKRAGRIPEIRDAAPRADRRLKSLRDNGNVRVGARVAGDIYAAECPVRATGRVNCERPSRTSTASSWSGGGSFSCRTLRRTEV